MFHSKITLPFPQKSHEFALKLTDLWITSLLFDLNCLILNMNYTGENSVVYLMPWKGWKKVNINERYKYIAC